MTTSGINDKWIELEMLPLANRLYILLDNVPKKAGLIHLIEEQATPCRIGTVLRVGDSVNDPIIPGGPHPITIEEGMRVLIGCHAGTNLYLWQYGMTNENWKICSRSEIMAILTKETVHSEEA